jgi:hypothetical protein
MLLAARARIHEIRQISLAYLKRMLAQRAAKQLIPQPHLVIPILRLSDLRLSNRGARWTLKAIIFAADELMKELRSRAQR